MTWFNALQLALGAGALAVVARSVRTLFFEAPLEATAFCTALDTALAAGQIGLARRIATCNEPAWPARLASAGLAEPEAARAAAAADEALVEFEVAAYRGLRAIVTLGRIASPLAFIGIVLEIGRVYGGGSGIEGLQRGWLLSTALERSVFTFVLGMSTLALCMASLGVLQRRARALTRDLQRVVRVLAREGAHERSEM